MTEKMLKFVDLNLETPNKRDVKRRLDDFKEIQKIMTNLVLFSIIHYILNS